MAITKDAPDRAIGGFVYFDSRKPLEKYLQFVLDNLSQRWNDMKSLAKFVGEHCDTLPLLPSSFPGFESLPAFVTDHSKDFPCVFDAAAMGQFIGGVDPIHILNGVKGDQIRGFVNPDSVFKIDQISLTWKEDDFLFKRPYADHIRIANLHIHSKDLRRWSSFSSYPDLLPIVYTVHPRDRDVLELSLNNIHYIHPFSIKVYIVTPNPVGLITLVGKYPEISISLIDERTFNIDRTPLDMKFGNRSGWYYQQLLKLSAGLSLGLSTYLVIDADTVFRRPVVMFTGNGTPLYNYGTEYYHPYFKHLYQLIGLEKQNNKSGICHHMIMNASVISEITAMIEAKHPGKKWYETMCELVDPTEKEKSGFSEYELMWNYLFKHKTTPFSIRPLKWKDERRDKMMDLGEDEFDYVSYHYWIK
jgi:hypothetical protein